MLHKVLIFKRHTFQPLTHSLTYLLTNYLLSPWSRVLLKKLAGPQMVKFFYGTRSFITLFTSVRHLFLSWASSIQSMPPHPNSWRSHVILSSHLDLGLPSGLLPSGFPIKTLWIPVFSQYVLQAPPISFLSIWSPEQNLVRSTDH